jgi:hypothetical protein
MGNCNKPPIKYDLSQVEGGWKDDCCIDGTRPPSSSTTTTTTTTSNSYYLQSLWNFYEFPVHDDHSHRSSTGTQKKTPHAPTTSTTTTATTTNQQQPPYIAQDHCLPGQAAGIRILEHPSRRKLAVVTSRFVLVTSRFVLGSSFRVDRYTPSYSGQVSEHRDQNDDPLYLFAEISLSGQGFRAWLDYSRVMGPKQKKHVCKIFYVINGKPRLDIETPIAQAHYTNEGNGGYRVEVAAGVDPIAMFCMSLVFTKVFKRASVGRYGLDVDRFFVAQDKM